LIEWNETDTKEVDEVIRARFAGFSPSVWVASGLIVTLVAVIRV